jgi:hypothetical protein
MTLYSFRDDVNKKSDSKHYLQGATLKILRLIKPVTSI